jgi:hypothetical protein
MRSKATICVGVVTGGPGGGKSTLLERVLRSDALGLISIALEEAIYTMRGSGLNPRTAEFQHHLVRQQMEAEEAALKQAERTGKRLVLTHRGTLDPCAFWQSFGHSRESFFASTGTALADHYRRYAFVLHLESAAVRLPESYVRYPHAHRPEDVAQADRLDNLLGELWGRHPRYIKLAAMPNIEEKISNGLRIICDFLDSVA